MGSGVLNQKFVALCLASTGAWYFTAFGTQYTVRFRRSPSVRWPASAGLFIYSEPFPDRSRKKLYIDNELREFRRRSPGQYVSLRIGGVARSYSLTGAAVPTPDAYRIGVRHIEGGQGSTAVRYVLAPGDIVELQSPKGGFVLPSRNEFPVVLIAGGIGITPFLSYLETLEGGANEPRVTLHYGCRDGETRPFYRRLEALRQRLPNALRVSVGLKEENELFVSTLREVPDLPKLARGRS